MRNFGSELFNKADGDRELMGLYFRKIASSTRFANALKDKKLDRPAKGNRPQIFGDMMDASWNEYMIISGREGSTLSKLAEEKVGVARIAFETLSEMDNVTFTITDESKMVGAIKFEEDFYEIKAVKHRDSGDINSPLEMVKDPRAFISELAEVLAESFKLSVVKNNLITVYDADENRISIRITKKKNPLF